MKVSEIIEKTGFEVLNEGADKDSDKVFCCDLLSIAMSKAPAGCTWVTIMGNVNSVAVCVLTEVSLLVLAEGICPDVVTLEKAKSAGVTMLRTELPVFDAALIVHNLISQGA